MGSMWLHDKVLRKFEYTFVSDMLILHTTAYCVFAVYSFTVILS